MRLGLAARLVLTVALLLVPAAAWVGYTVHEERERVADAVEARLTVQSTDVSTGVRNHLILARQSLRLIAAMPEVHADADSCNEFMTDMGNADERFRAFARANLDGWVDCATAPVTLPIYVGDRTHVQRAIRNETFAVGQIRIGNFTGQPAISTAFPFRDANGTMQGLVLAVSPVETLLGFDRIDELPRGSVATVIDSEGVILARSRDADRYVGQTVVDRVGIDAATSRPGEMYEARGVDGVRRLYVASPLVLESDPAGVFVVTGVPVDAAYEPVVEEGTRNIVFVLGLLVLVAIAGVVAVHRVVLGPLREVCDAADQLRRGDLRARVRDPVVRRSDEIGGLAETFNLTTDRLVHQIRELERVNERLSELDRIKNEIINTMAHELRTPMVAMNLQISLLQERLQDTEDVGVRSGLQMVDRNVKRLSRLVQSLLKVASIQAGQLHLEPRPMPLRPVLKDLEADWAARAKEMGLRFSVETTDAEVRAEAHAVKEILDELLDNAFKFTPPGGTVAVRTEPTDDHVALVVTDTGIGWDATDAGAVRPLEPRGDPVRGGRIGIGIGLYIAQALAEQLDGVLQHRSAGPGHGTTATVRFERA